MSVLTEPSKTPSTASAAPVRVAFVAGWGRSGSTLLDRMLGQVHGLVSCGELREIWQRGPLEDRRCGCGVSFSQCGFWRDVGEAGFGGWDHVDADRLARLRHRLDRAWTLPLLYHTPKQGRMAEDLREYRSAFERLYRGIAAASGANVIVDSSKLATHGLILRTSGGIDVRVIHLLRDSRGVVHSWSKRMERGDSEDGELMRRYGPLPAALRYDLYNAAAMSLEGLGLPYLPVRYEDLVRGPRVTIRRILDHVGARDELSFLSDGSVQLGVDHLVDGNPMRFKVGQVQIRVDDAWKESLEEPARRQTTLLTYPLLRHFGYVK